MFGQFLLQCTHKALIINMTGDSYRLKETKE
jgi:hemin uptake protein HemP